MEKDYICPKGSNTEYVPTKCRITRPPPPKPASNPLQFIKVGPCPLYKKDEQETRVEPVKVVRQEDFEEVEEWQHNLDNWKTNRRKRQEHIIERVEEVKKIEQECQDRVRRKRTTFSDILEKRNLGNPKFNIPIYQEDTNELKDFGISSVIFDTKVSENISTPKLIYSEEPISHIQYLDEINSANKGLKIEETEGQITVQQPNEKEHCTYSLNNGVEQYTYEGAIQNYRQRIGCTINESSLNKAGDIHKNKEYSEVETLLPKGNLYKRKEVFESEMKYVEKVNDYEQFVPRKLPEDFTNSQSIKERLQCLEKCSVPVPRSVPKCDLPAKGILDELKKQVLDNEEINTELSNELSSSSDSFLSNLDSKGGKESSKISEQMYLEGSKDDIFINKHIVSCSDLNALYQKRISNNNLEDFPISYPASISSNDAMVLSSDKEDSGIHTADVSCSVSQSDEAFDDIDLPTNMMPKFIEKLNIGRNFSYDSAFLNKQFEEQFDNKSNRNQSPLSQDDYNDIKSTSQFLHNEIGHICENDLDKFIRNKNESITDSEAQKNELASDSEGNTNGEVFGHAFTSNLQPPAVKPPPPPIHVNQTYEIINERGNKNININKITKDDIKTKRSTFLGLAKPTPGVLDALPTKKMTASTTQKMHTPFVENRQSARMFHMTDPDVPTAQIISLQKNEDLLVEDDIWKKEREIIELVEKEEKFKTLDSSSSENCPYVSPIHYSKIPSYNDPSHYSNFEDRDSEVLRVEHELLQLEREELKRQRENILFREINQEFKHNFHSHENLCDVLSPANKNYCNSMPELNHALESNRKVELPNKSMWDEAALYYKSMNNIDNTYNKTILNPGFSYDTPRRPIILDHRKSMSDLQSSLSVNHAVSSDQSMRMPTKDQRETLFRTHKLETDNEKKKRPAARHSMPAETEMRLRHPGNCNKLKNNYEIKKYNQHWLIQEAEFRRISQKKPSSTHRMPHEKSAGVNNIACSNQNIQAPYLGHSQKRHVYSVPYSSAAINDGQNVMLSVSGKKKCSYCGNELGRGAAMIIETLCLFYHIECFKCCVCHVELGDGLMGTDVRVRNQKLHCQNCYSSDDGIKFSCV